MNPQSPQVYVELSSLDVRADPVHQPEFRAAQTLRLEIFPEAPVPLSRPLVAGTSVFTSDWITDWHEHPKTSFAPRISCYFVHDAVISGLGQVWIDNQLVVARDLMPSYVYKMNLGLPANGGALCQRVWAQKLRVVDTACVVMPGSQNIYGHFLIETIPYILLVRRMAHNTGLKYRYLLPSCAAPWLKQLLYEDLRVPEESVEFYNPSEERILLRRAILPAMMHQDHGFHPAFSELLDDLFERMNIPQLPQRLPRIFLVRGNFSSHSERKCINEEALVRHAHARHGFIPVSMEKLPWCLQISIMKNAEIVVGLFGSAMHATLFSPHDTRVACLGISNLTQSHIAALRGHTMAYLTTGFELEGNFTIDEHLFERFLDKVCASAP